MNPEIRYLAQQLLHAGLAPLCERDRRVITRVARRVHTARDVNQEFEQNLTFGDKLADKVAVLGGSWTFIMGFCAFLLAWALLNAVVLAGSAFDPYPFVFLNLLLSMVAALQAPIIMMSQNRQAAKDRLAAALDYEINVKSESAIAELHEKVDQMMHAVQTMAELQQAKALQPFQADDLPARSVGRAPRAARGQTEAWAAAEVTPA